jgi:hypothetical protein
MHWLMMQSTWIPLPCFAMMESCRSIHLFLVCDDVASYKVCLKPTVLQDYEAIDSKGGPSACPLEDRCAGGKSAVRGSEKIARKRRQLPYLPRTSSSHISD